MTFNNPPLLLGEVRNGVQWFVLSANLVWQTRVGDGYFRVKVPAGFETDFASVPRFFSRLFPATGTWSKPAVVHDYLYQAPGGCSRFLADCLFREAMIQEGVKPWRAWLMWVAVRCFGRGVWR